MGPNFFKMWIFRVKKVEKDYSSSFLRKMDFFDVFDSKNPHFLKFGPTYIDVFFDEDFKNDLIFLKKWAPKGVKWRFL